jgi:four helix bundle protein
MRDYTKIKAWGLADDLTVDIYKSTKSFPKDELYAMTSQIRRAASSVAANIVEGASRSSHKDYLHFLYIARGSLHETHYFVHLAGRLEYLDADAKQRLTTQAEEASRTLTGLIKAVEKEVGLVGRSIAKLSSLLVLSIGSTVFSLKL